MKMLSKLSVFVTALVASVAITLSSCGSDEPEVPESPSTTETTGSGNEETSGGGNNTGGGNVSTPSNRHVRSIGWAQTGYGVQTETKTYDNFVYDSSDRIISVDCTDSQEGKSSVQLSYSDEEISCIVTDEDGSEEVFKYTLKNGRITEELWDGSRIKYEYTDDRLTCINDPGYSSVTYSYDDEGNFLSFTRNKRGQQEYTSTFYYNKRKFAGPLLFMDIPRRDIFCIEGTEYNWVLLFSGFFKELTPKDYLPYKVVSDGTEYYSLYDAESDRQGYVSALSFVGQPGNNYFISIDWE